MKVYFYTYPAIGQNVGGLQTQIYNTKEQLEKKGITVKLFDCWNDKLDDCDILHTFALGDLSQVSVCELAKAKGKKVVVSTLLHRKKGFALLKEKVKRFISKVSPTLMLQMYFYHRTLCCADAVIALSETEKNYIEDLFPCCKGKTHVVPNGVHDSFLHYDQTNSKKLLAENGLDISDYILHVGQICKNKNQLAILQATEQMDCPIVFIGQPTEQVYYDKLCEAASQRSNVYVLPPVESSSELLKALYSQAKVFILPSFHEVFPLTALEAIAMDNHVVLTKESMVGNDLQEYGISLVAPNDITAMTKLLNDKINAEHICFSNEKKKKLTWAYAAERLYSIYESIT